ncbi:hypothetical protein HUA74_33900 [Myxococcus sp. CA051A]|uniref:Lipoprotein n=1 Tax=Myxococcus llanfairpwllgwyngyllgogerychwyrndrobwllllantysiliogogogochensis TaxID=2590453 RepID=A0A540WPL0_9BACT|nr:MULTISPECIES: hypothetical protein [Myxococcus]NTX65666.1 hypothetical protein [Myxococcus sp. CA051A]TQF10955.1 hypothetical protein FJV41_36860 [Myxococcus llanfairpwllgwyngyllgogerychwyrndrobwllllantysiliogogogochensis]
MLRALAGLLPLCLLATACGTSARQQALLERREAIRASNDAFAAEELAHYRGKSGFQETRWGMSPDEVRALHPEARTTSSQGDLRVTTRVTDRLATVDFKFTLNKLATVSLRFDTDAPLREDFGALSELLSMKYGAPTSRRDTAEDAEERLRMAESLNLSLGEGTSFSRTTGDDHAYEERRRIEALAARTDYQLEKTWKDSETKLQLSGWQQPDSKRLTLNYVSRYLEPHLSKRSETQDLDLELKRAQAQEL